MTPPSSAARAILWIPLALVLPLACLLWAYWSTLVEIAQIWSHDAQYSHGWLVPVFAAALLLFRRSLAPSLPLRPCWWGLLLLAAGVALRLGGVYFWRIWLTQIALIPMLAGLCLLIGGWAACRWAWPSIAFLAFMIPLPYSVSGRLSGQLQEIATIASTFCLQTLGVPALAEGNTILLSEVEIGVVEACSGLRMLVIFFALSTAVALLIRRPLWEKIAIVLSAIPIALVSNILRITATGLLHEHVSSEVANMVFHDLAGWLMMPLALGMLGTELMLFTRLLIEPGDQPARAAAPPRSRPAARPALATAAGPTPTPDAAPRRRAERRRVGSNKPRPGTGEPPRAAA